MSVCVCACLQELRVPEHVKYKVVDLSFPPA